MYVQIVGPLSLEDTRAFCALGEAMLAEHGRLFVICDLSQSKSFSPEGRRYLAQWKAKHSVTAIAQYGVSVMAQAITVLLTAAIRLFGGRMAEIKRVKDEAEGRAWIAEQKLRIDAPSAR